jgi:acetyltransferase
VTQDAERRPTRAADAPSEADASGDAALPRIRAMREDDLERETRFVEGLSEESLYQRLFSPRHLSREELERLTHPDPVRECALVATVGAGDAEAFVGVARYAVGRDLDECEFAIVVADAWQHHGLGHRLLAALVAEARRAGLRRIMGYTFMTNLAMRELARDLGFSLTRCEGDNTLVVMSQVL